MPHQPLSSSQSASAGSASPSTRNWIAALPVFNEVNYVDEVLDQVLRYCHQILVVDDGSTDGTSQKLDDRANLEADRITVIHHESNQGYGAALQSVFKHTIQQGFEGVVTLDCDGQHQPHRIPRFIEAAQSADIVSGSRYLKKYDGDSEPPQERMFINRRITADLNRKLGFSLTDAFCGFKAYRRQALEQITITEKGYAMPLELWVEAAAADLRVIEVPVPLIYLDLERSFGGSLDHAETRLAYYNQILDTAIQAARCEGRLSNDPNCERLAGA